MSDRAAALAFAAGATWAMHEPVLNAQIRALLTPGTEISAARQLPALGPRSGAGSTGIGVLRVFGPISYRPGPWSFMFGGCSVVELSAGLRELVADAQVESILVEFESPGGDSAGLPELSTELRAARAVKPVIAYINTYAFSAAYWLACQCSEIVLTTSSDVGSVGCFVLHEDFSKMNERIGYTPTFVYAGRYKTETFNEQPLADETRKYLQGIVDAGYVEFVTDIVRGRGRGLTDAIVRKTFGEGRIVLGAEAIKRRMADRVFTQQSEVIAYAAVASKGGMRVSAATESEDLEELEMMRLELDVLERS